MIGGRPVSRSERKTGLDATDDPPRMTVAGDDWITIELAA
jgi:hypothetical protein